MLLQKAIISGHKRKCCIRLFTDLVRRASTSCDQIHQKPKLKQRLKDRSFVNDGMLTCVTYATAEKYNLVGICGEFESNKSFELKHFPSDMNNAMCLSTCSDAVVKEKNSPGSILMFREGMISFWNISGGAIKCVMGRMKDHSNNVYSPKIIHLEKEEIIYKSTTTSQQPMLKDDIMYLNNESEVEMQMYAFSNALAMSVKLAHWEHDLDALINSIKSIPTSLVSGNPLKLNSTKLTKKLGEIFLIRQKLNLQYNLIDVPDVYWDRNQMEDIYLQTVSYLHIHRRVKQMNEKLSYCSHMVELLSNMRHEEKAIRLEVLIVILIFIEIVFEVAHLYMDREKTESTNNQNL